MDRERPEMYTALGRTIQVLRTDQGLDRKELAERAGISYSYLAAIETGRKPPSSKVLFAIAEALGLKTHELMASAETRQERHSGHHRSARASWFHSEMADAAPMAASRFSPAPEVDAMFADRADLPMTRNVPRSPAGFVMELERIARNLDDDDRDMLLRLAHKLASRHT